jgi:hypothetical protein
MIDEWKERLFQLPDLSAVVLVSLAAYLHHKETPS